MSQGISWATATTMALNSFESPSGLHSHTQLPITLQQSSYDPYFSSTTLFDFALNQRLAPSNDHAGYAPGRTPIDHEQHQRAPWGGFTLNQGFSGHAQTSSGYEDQDMSFQYIQMPSRNAMAIIPIYENATPFNTNAPASNPNLYPHNAMPLTIKHPEFRQQHQQQQGQQQAPQNEDAWTAHIMNNVERLEHSAQASTNPQQPPLTISQSRPQSYAQPQPPSYQQPQQQQFTLEQIEQALLYQSVLSAQQSNGLATPYEKLTANLHDEVAASRLNNGNKEIATMPSAIPSVPSLLVRYPASSQRFVANHPYTSPRFAPQSLNTGAGGTGSGGARAANGASARSMRPIVPRITTKRESLSVPAPTTTAYLAGLRRHVPVAELASERAPVEPYPRQGGGLAYPLAIANGGGSGGGSASTATSSLPPESPFSGTLGLGGAGPERSRERVGSMSPKKEQQGGWYANGLPDGGSLRLTRGQERPGTGMSSHSGGSLLSPVMSRGGLLSPQMQMQAPQVAPQVRANAARKRADDEILQHSFRAEADWRRRMVLEAVLSSSFVADNALEPVSGPGEANTNGANGNGIAASALCVGLDAGLGSPGKSVYAVFLEQVEKSEWRCLFGDREHPCPSQAVAFRRLERALDHVRSHLNHRPFGCKGQCQKGDSCDARFFARSHLQDHAKRTESACCETCGQVIRIQNMPRHRMAH